MQGSFLSRESRSTRLALLFSILLVLTLLLVAALPPTSSATQEQAQSDRSEKHSRPEFVPGQALVRYRSELLAKQKTLEKLVAPDGRQLSIQLERFDGADIVPGLRLAHVAPEDTMAAIEALKAQPDVLYAEPNYLLHLDATPNDPRFSSGELYGLLKIGAPTAWDTIKGSTDTVQSGFGHPRIVVGVIDEGIDVVHEDLAANIWTNPGEGAVPDGLDNDGNGFVDDIHGYDFALNSGTITAQTHGTHVAGTIGAVGNNSTGVVGVNWSVGLMSLKFIDGSQADTADAIRACNYAKMMRDLWVSSGGTQGANLRVLNNSYGDNKFTQSFLDSINALNSSGILFVASAGNVDGFSTQPDNDLVQHYPSGYAAPNVIGVASTGQTDNLATDSHFGAASVHLGAPGIGILSTTPNNTYSFLSGTSMATPHVAGAAALLLAQNPNLTIQQLKGLLIFNGDPVASLAGKTLTGRRLNVANSLTAIAENDVTPPGTVTSFHVNSQSGRAFNIGWTASGDDGASGQASLYQLTFTEASSSEVVFLKSLLPAASGVGQSIDVKLRYRHTSGTLTLREFDNVGNEGVPATLAVSVPPVEGDPYVTSLGVPVALSTGGVGLATNCDDCSKTQALAFTFPFFGENFNSVKVTSNGAMYFTTPPANDATSSSFGLSQFKMIAGLWDDLRTDHHAGDDIYVVTPDASRMIFRWQAVTFGNGTAPTELPVSFEIELRSNGTILTRYGSGGQSPDADIISRVVGISGGELDTYVIPSHTSEGTVIDLTNAQEVTFLPRSLTPQLAVALSNPGSGAVSITVSQADDNGLGNGITPFTRHYAGSPTVSLTAPATANGSNFQKWQRDGVDLTTNQTANVTMDVSHTMTPVYFTSLTVASSNPNSGVSITVSPNDNGGLGNGTTQFTRTYNINSNVNLTAPATAGGNLFQKWQRDGADWSTIAATSVSMDAPHIMTAVYAVPSTLTVASSNPGSGVSVTVSPSDAGGQGNGTTQFTRNYLPNITVLLSTPATAGGNNFRKWQRDGVDWSTSAATSVAMDANHTMTAIYVTPRTLTVASSNPGSGVSITVSPNDNNSLGNGTTQFTRSYDNNTSVNLTAPTTVAGNTFRKWQRDGVDFSTNAATSVTMDANHTMTAIYITLRTLSVASSNPSSGVSITVSPNDNNSQGNGTTPFGRTYDDGSLVNLTAPTNASGNNFVKWQRDGVDLTTNPATSVTMDANHTLTAIYVTPRTLTVASSNPSSGVSITVSPNDNNSQGNGTTQFARIYNEGSVVSLTAPSSFGGNVFLKWQRDGVDFDTNATTSVTIDGNRTMTAFYVIPRALTVASMDPNSGVSITVSPNDSNGLGNGTTQFTRSYGDGSVVNLTAPATAGGSIFQKWQRDGVDLTTNPATSLTMDAAHTMTAVYLITHTLTVASSNPASGVSITVSPNDTGGLGNGATQFARNYVHNTSVNLTAPATAAGNNFLKWQRDGGDFSVNPAISVTVDANHTMMAVYVTPRTLTVASVNPNSGANITVSPNDNNGLGNGATQFTRTYNEGAVVSLTAAVTAGGNIFQKWQRDGVDFSIDPATSVAIDGNRTMTAVYANIVQFSLPQFDVFEDLVMSGGSAIVTVTRSGNTSSPASVDYATSDGSATQKGDYTLAAGTLTFAAGETSKTFPILIIDDVFQEGTESFSVTLSNPIGTTLGVRSVTTVKIFDNDGSTGTNPLDNANAQFFVRQHYLDFFTREPDAGGLAFWSNQITECDNIPTPGGFANAQQCREIRGINVSGAFFKSIEFQETGYLVERMYKVAYGDATGTSTFGGAHTLPVPVIRYLEFMRDTQQIGKGVVVGQPGWEQQLENNKVAFALDFVTRTRFITDYPTTLTPTALVNQLFAKAGVTPTAQQLQDAINEFGGAGNTADTAARGRALRRVAENPSLNSAETNKAFVLMQYLGYLRRNPNDAPEAGLDYTGFDFWLTKLNQFNGNFVNADMVKAFIVSGEYRHRFGP